MSAYKYAVCFSILLFSVSAHAAPIVSPATIAEKFCKITQHNDTKAFLKLATPSLAKIIRDAERKDQIIADKTPGDKPPLGDGIPLQSYQDDAPICSIGEVITRKDHSLVIIHHQFTSKKDIVANWDDRLVLNLTSTGWKIDDIQYAPRFDRNLRDELAHAFDDYK